MNKLNNEIKITRDLSLIKIYPADQEKLVDLMYDIYPQSYAYLWQDQGSFYIQTTFGAENLKKELRRPDAPYYFVSYKSGICGILRVLHNEPCVDFPNVSAAKLHRIYLNSIYQGKGIGRRLMHWVGNSVKENNHTLLWLEVMDSQPAAFNFYSKLGFQTGGRCELQYKFLNRSFKGMQRMYKYV